LSGGELPYKEAALIFEVDKGAPGEGLEGMMKDGCGTQNLNISG